MNKSFLVLFFKKEQHFFFEPLLWRAPPTNPRVEKQKTFHGISVS